MLRKTLAVIAGIVAASLIINYGNVLIFRKHPVLESFTKLSWDPAKQLVDRIPSEAWSYLIIVWFLSAFVCGFLVKLISHSSKISLPIGCGLFLTIAAILDQFAKRPHPMWIVVVGVLIFVPSAFLGYKACRVRLMSLQEETAEEDNDLA